MSFIKITINENIKTPVKIIIRNRIDSLVNNVYDVYSPIIIDHLSKVFFSQGIREGEGEKWEKPAPITLRRRVNPSARKDKRALLDTRQYSNSITIISRTYSGNKYILEGGSDEPEKAKNDEDRYVDFPEGRRFVPSRRVHFITGGDINRLNRVYETQSAMQEAF